MLCHTERRHEATSALMRIPSRRLGLALSGGSVAVPRILRLSVQSSEPPQAFLSKERSEAGRGRNGQLEVHLHCYLICFHFCLSYFCKLNFMFCGYIFYVTAHMWRTEDNSLLPPFRSWELNLYSKAWQQIRLYRLSQPIFKIPLKLLTIYFISFSFGLFFFKSSLFFFLSFLLRGRCILRQDFSA